MFIRKNPFMNTTGILKGLFVGLVAGAVGTLAKTVWEDQFPVRSPQTDSPPARLAQRATQTTLSDSEKKQAESAIHWSFGTLTGGMYGTLVELAPEARAGHGMLFGLGLYGLTHATTLPAADLEPNPLETDPTFAFNEFVGHFVYAGMVEMTRRALRQVV